MALPLVSDPEASLYDAKAERLPPAGVLELRRDTA